jgi:uncharacterized membrane protein
MTHDKLTRTLGWASAGLGAPLVLASDAMARVLGIEDGKRQRAVLTSVGAREWLAAAGLLGQGSPAWLWSRVAGDLTDLALLGNELAGHLPATTGAKARGKKSAKAGAGSAQSRTAAATAMVLAITAVDLYAAVSRGVRSRRNSEVSLTAAVTVTSPRRKAYERWRQLDGLPAFMAHLDDVTVTGPRTSHWRATAPFGRTVEWDAEITEDVPGERIAWRSLDPGENGTQHGTGNRGKNGKNVSRNGSKIRNAGTVCFIPAPNGQDTEVHVTLSYALPAGKGGQAVARYFGEEPHQQLDDDLRRFKQVLETGEVVRSEGAPGGKRARGEFPQRPARPLTGKELAEVLS